MNAFKNRNEQMMYFISGRKYIPFKGVKWLNFSGLYQAVLFFTFFSSWRKSSDFPLSGFVRRSKKEKANEGNTVSF
jgi:hypothetical protein